jgi:hypothetical protein
MLKERLMLKERSMMAYIEHVLTVRPVDDACEAMRAVDGEVVCFPKSLSFYMHSEARTAE